jgi:hypothetical protein
MKSQPHPARKANLGHFRNIHPSAADGRIVERIAFAVIQPHFKKRGFSCSALGTDRSKEDAERFLKRASRVAQSKGGGILVYSDVIQMESSMQRYHFAMIILGLAHTYNMTDFRVNTKDLFYTLWKLWAVQMAYAPYITSCGKLIYKPNFNCLGSGSFITSIAGTIERVALDIVVKAKPVVAASDDSLTVLPKGLTVEKYKGRCADLGFILKFVRRAYFKNGSKVPAGIGDVDQDDYQPYVEFLSLDLVNMFPTSWPRMVASALCAKYDPSTEQNLVLNLQYHPRREFILECMRRAGWGA